MEYPSAWYHVMNRGRGGERVFERKDDYGLLIEIFQEAIEVFRKGCVVRLMTVRFLLLALVLAVAMRAAAPAIAADIVDPTVVDVLELRGTIGKGLAVHMHLEIRNVVRDHDFVVGEQYTGYYFYDRHGEHIQLKGYFNAQGVGGAADEPTIEIAEYVRGKKTGVFVGAFTDKAFKGQWESTDSEQSLPFNLRVSSSKAPK